MKNKLIIIDKNNEKKEYNPLVRVSTNSKEYLLYASDKTNKMGDTICYVSTYEYVDGHQKLESVSESEIEVLDRIFAHVINTTK